MFLAHQGRREGLSYYYQLFTVYHYQAKTFVLQLGPDSFPCQYHTIRSS
jgi:hypothetical protein